MPESARKKKITLVPDWSHLSEDLLHLISTKLEDHCFDVVHARSVCTSWRSSFPFPSSLLRPSYSLPTFPAILCKYITNLCTLEKVPLFLFRVRAPHVDDGIEYFLGGIGPISHESNDMEEVPDESDESDNSDNSEVPDESDNSENTDESVDMENTDESDDVEIPSPLQCSVKINNPESDYPTLVKMLDCHIILLGHKYRTIGQEHDGVAVLPLDQEGRKGEFVVILSHSKFLLKLTSVEMKWEVLRNMSNHICSGIVTFRGKFYAVFDGKTVVIDPYSLKVTLELPSAQELHNFLVPSGDDVLFLVEATAAGGEITCRASRLDEEAGQWVEVSDLGDIVLFVNDKQENFSCSAKELPLACGLTGNSILFTNGTKITSVTGDAVVYNLKDSIKTSMRVMTFGVKSLSDDEL